MSAVRFVNTGEAAVLDAYIALANIAGGFTLKLFTNDVTAGLTDAQINALTAAAFTEATFPGYAAITFNSGWTVTPGDPTVAINTTRSFIRSSTGSPQRIDGYYVIAAGSGVLQWFVDFDVPFVMEHINDQLNVVPRFHGRDEEDTVT